MNKLSLETKNCCNTWYMQSFSVLRKVAFIHQAESQTENLKLPLWAILEKNSKVDEDGFHIWEEDIIFHGNNKENLISERTARKDLNSRWPQGKIPYKIDRSLNSQESKSAISQAMQLWMDGTCVNFVNSPTIRNQPHLVLKHTGTGCNSWVGIYDEHTTDQTVSLDQPGCSTSVPTVAHELGHAIGLWHEQDRLDRNSHLNVYTTNMGDNKIYFETANDDVMNYDVPYEYSSLMQYTPDAFSSNGKLTLVPKDPMAFPLMGNAQKITYLDFKLVNRMYNCSDKCQNPPTCQNGGYATWNTKKGCRCECPPGFSGPNCQNRVYVAPPCGGKITTPTRFQSPNYPNNHPADLRCAWLIEAPRGKVPTLSFHDFNLMARAGAENKCYWSALRIRNGNLLGDDPGQIHCADELNHNAIRGKSNQMLLVLTSMYDSARGFDVSVKFA
uniref:Metalloendopeptidase n=1 Tax=Strigamia maritima TaxID=126957 RepID=T1JBK4_STRMM